MSLRKSIIIIFCLISLSSCSKPRYVEFKGFAQGGTYSVKADLSGVNLPRRQIAADIDSVLNRIDFSLSGYNKNSLLSRRNAGEDIEPDRYFSELLALSEKYRELSGGAFDVAAAPLFDIWGFGFTADSLPSPDRIAQALDECRIGKKIYCEGLNASGRGWAIGIDTPEDGNQMPGASLSGIWVSDGRPHGVVTSGNYRKFYIKDGKKYAHTIDPRTGYPVTHDLLSATVVAPSAAEADALATICMVVGPEDAQALILSLPDTEACLITSNGSWTSPGFKN